MTEIKISESGSMYCNIRPDTYREYHYNDDFKNHLRKQI